jgi:hypothetical protein
MYCYVFLKGESPFLKNHPSRRVNELLERRFTLEIHPSKRVNVYILEGESPFGKGKNLMITKFYLSIEIM